VKPILMAANAAVASSASSSAASGFKPVDLFAQRIVRLEPLKDSQVGQGFQKAFDLWTLGTAS